MNNKFHVLDHPMLLFAGISETGRTKDLQPGVIGVFDDKTGQALNGSVLKDNRPVKFAQGSYHTKDALGQFYTGLQKSLKTADFLPKDVYHIEYSAPRESQNEKWILGWDGINDCESLKFECGRTHTFRLRIWGEGVYNDFAKQILRDVSINTACCDSDECGDGCPDNTVHCRKYTKELVKAINSDVEISKFVRAEVVLPNIAAKTFTHKLYCMTQCDNGDQEALNLVQAQYPGIKIERTKREGSISTYETECLLPANEPADYVPSGSVYTAICGSCASGQTLLNASDVWIVTRSLSPTDDVTEDRTFTLTGTSGTADILIGSTTITATFNTDLATTASDLITAEAANILAAEGVVITSDNATIIVTGAVSPITITNQTGNLAATAVTTQQENYASNVAASYAGVTEQTFLGASNGLASVQILVPVGTSVVAIDSDSVIQGQSIGERCSLAGASPIEWSECGDRYKETRTLCVILPYECDTPVDRTAEIEAFYAGGKNDIVPGSVSLVAGGVSGSCEAKYEIQQYSNCLDVACLSEGIAEYGTIEPFEGKVWTECPCTTEPTPTQDNKCGIRLEVSSNFDKFGDCSWDPSEYYTFKPVFMEIFEVDEETGDFCKKQVQARKIQDAIQANQQGEWVAREYIKLAAYLYHDAFNSDPRLRNVLDQTIYQMIDRNAKYHVYYVKYKQYRPGSGSYDPEIYEIPIVVKDGLDRTGLETWLNGLFSKYGVTVQPRIGQPNY